MKLRSLNTPKLLYWLNVGLIVVVIMIGCFEVSLWIEQKRGMELGEEYFGKSVESSWAIDFMMMGKVLT